VPLRALGANFATATPMLQKFACSACLTAQVRGPCRFARVLPRRDGLGPTKKRTQHARFFPWVRFAGILCGSGNVVPREERCAWSVCWNLCDCAGTSLCRARSFFVHVYCAPNFAAGPRSPVGAAVVPLYHAQVQGPSGHARVLPRSICIVQAVVGALARAAGLLSGFVGTVALPQSPVGAADVAPYQAQVRGPSGRARVLSLRNGFVQAVIGAWACGAKKLSGLLGAVAFALLHGS